MTMEFVNKRQEKLLASVHKTRLFLDYSGCLTCNPFNLIERDLTKLRPTFKKFGRDINRASRYYCKTTGFNPQDHIREIDSVDRQMNRLNKQNGNKLRFFETSLDRFRASAVFGLDRLEREIKDNRPTPFAFKAAASKIGALGETIETGRLILKL